MKSFRITVNGKAYDVDVEEINNVQALEPRATAPSVTAPTTKPVVTSSASASAPSGSAGNTKIEAPMQGKIVAVKVAEGELVNNGDVVAILEAMKMENEIIATESGTVASVNVAAGQAVDVGDLIISLD